MKIRGATWLERRVRSKQMADMELIVEYEISFDEKKRIVSVSERWEIEPDGEFKAWLVPYIATSFASKQAFNMESEDSIRIPTSAAWAVEGVSTEYDLETVASIDDPSLTWFAQVVRSVNGDGMPFVQTPYEGKKARSMRMTAEAAVALARHLRNQPDCDVGSLLIGCQMLVSMQGPECDLTDEYDMTFAPVCVMMNLEERGYVATFTPPEIAAQISG